MKKKKIREYLAAAAVLLLCLCMVLGFLPRP